MACMVLPGFHNPNEIQLDKTIHMRYSPTSPTTPIVALTQGACDQVNKHSQDATASITPTNANAHAM
eukprot:2051924-Amphidinium_carterae.1